MKHIWEENEIENWPYACCMPRLVGSKKLIKASYDDPIKSDDKVVTTVKACDGSNLYGVYV